MDARAPQVLPVTAEPTPAVDETRAWSLHDAHRGRLFRKYLLLILSLVTLSLLASGAISVYFSYQENKAALASVQHEKAIGAASRIEQYIRQISQQLAYAALPQLDASATELRRLEFLKLLRQAPEVTDIAQLDASGHELIAVSRLGMDVIGSGKDRSGEPAFRNARRGQPWYGPVYFRKETEPYMTISLRSGGDAGPVTVADVNLKFIWDVVSRIKIGDKGKAYVVDSKGFLVADPDIGLVLRKTNLSDLAHVKTALATPVSSEPAMLSSNLGGTEVLTSVAAIEPLDWKVFVEQPVAEVYERLNASIVRTGLLLLAGLVISALAALALARGMVRPIRILSEGAQRIGAGELEQKIVVRTGDELEALADHFNRMSGQLRESYAGLERKVEERTRELKNSLEQQTAISEILRVISSSPTDVQPVMDAVAERAAHLCDAPFARILLVDRDMLGAVAQYSAEHIRMETVPVPLKRSSITGRAVLDRETVHYADIVPVVDGEFPDARENAERMGIRAALAVPLMREGGAYGAIFLFRQEPGLFSPDQVALLQTFARQAAIAIDNVRLFNETREALEQQTAISEILRVISSSPGDVRPMLNAVAERALNLCGAAESGIFLAEGDTLRYAAGFGDMSAMQEGELVPLTRGSASGRAVVDRTVIHVEDLAAAPEDEFPLGRELQKRTGSHAILSVPLMREDHAIGAITLWRMEARAFTAKQIALVKTFADQAAIAIENVRLFNETKEALDRQTATGEILRVISGSPTDTQPVFDSIAERAAVLCNAKIGIVTKFDGESIHLVAVHGVSPEGVEAIRASYPLAPDAAALSAHVIRGRTPLQLPDVFADAAYGRKHLAQKVGFRSIMGVPMLRKGEIIGSITVAREAAGNFPEKQVDLLKTFADQAVIAIDNVRLFNETKEALEQQTAISEVLRVISGSPGDVRPMLQAVAERALKLCDAAESTIVLVEHDALRCAASFGSTPSLEEGEFMPLTRGSATGRAVIDRESIHMADLAQAPEEEFPVARELQKRIGHHAILSVPLMREDRAIGAIALWRMEARAFTDKQIALVKTFADQAAIAIENVRLFNATKEALEQQTAIAEILRVISGSPTDVQPVLDAIAERAARLCDASAASMYLTDGDMLRHLASKGPSPDPVSSIDALPINRESVSGRALLERRTIEVRDMLDERAEYPLSYEIAQRVGHRTVIVTPLFREGKPFGTILLRRREVRSFTEREVALLQTFGDQAAIALENIRLFNETKEALDQQRASGEILSAISSSIADTKPVFDKIVQSCERLFAGKHVGINLVGDDGTLHLGAYHGPKRDAFEQLMSTVRADDTTATGRAIQTRTVQHFPDIEQPDVPEGARLGGRATGMKAAIYAPMLWEGKGLGVIWVARDYVGPFSEKEIALLKTFADQAVIAIQNSRLFNETKEALDQQRASGEVLATISNSIADTAPVFDKILESCERLFAGRTIGINLVGEDGLIRLGAYHGPGRDELEKIWPAPIDELTGSGAAILHRSIVHFPDVEHGEGVSERTRRACKAIGVKGVIFAPMLGEGKSIGAIFVGRDYVGPFSDKDIALLKTFADQAVIAIQNARLFNETNEALSQQTATAEVLKTISRTTFELTPVLETLIENATRLAVHHGALPDQLEFMRAHPVQAGPGTVVGRTAMTGQIVHLADAQTDPSYTWKEAQNLFGFRSIFGVPMLRQGEPIGVVVMWRKEVRPFSDRDIRLVATFADQAVIAIENVRLFREIQEKSQQLEIANKHKSDFLANMSHELRTPLNAIIGFSEVLIERLFGDLNDKQDDYLKDIHSSGTHLLALINDILDLSKVEAGRMELDLSQFDLPSVITTAMTLVRERALQHGITLGLEIDPILGLWTGDERKVKQILLNLLSNAVKFTPDGGRVDVSAKLDGTDAVVAVRDTGIGIAPEDQAAVFEEFRQVGDDYTRKQEGTGLGLALTRKFIELHGGRIWVESALGAGSVFTFTLPSRT